jgi:hypothetical protein
MIATSSKTAFAALLTVHCRSIAATMAGYWRFWRAANVPRFRNLRSDYPLFFTSCNCIRQCRCAHAHRLLMSHRVAPSGARSRTPRLVLGLLSHRENHALCPKHSLSSAWVQRFVSRDSGPIYLNTEPRQCPLRCASSPKRYVCRTLFAHTFNLKESAVELQIQARFDTRNVKYGLIESRLTGSHPAQQDCSVDRQISSTQRRFMCSRRLSSPPSYIRTKGGTLCLTVEDTYASNRCSQPKSLACPSMPILPT